MVDRAGEQLGNYRLIQRLGRGGFAEVYLGKHIHLGTPAAIKILHGQLDKKDLETFLEEAKRIAHLQHAHIVRTLDFGIDAFNTPYLVMDYAPYGTLRQLYPEGERVPLATIISYVKQIAAALQYTHDHKLVHRDVKPQNMLVGNSHQVLLADFGIAVLAHSTSSMTPQNTSGTVQYMAPEHIRGQARPASDQYSLGITVYEWLSGVRPFHGSHFIDVAMQHLQSVPPPLHTKLPTISLEIEQAVMRTLEKEPEKRFPSVEKFAQVLEQAFQAEQRVGLPPVIKTHPGKLLSTYQVPKDSGSVFSWTHNGLRMVYRDATGKLTIQDIATGKRVSPSTANLAGIAMGSPDGRYIAFYTASTLTMQVWDVNTDCAVTTYTFTEQTSDWKSNVWLPIAWSSDNLQVAFVVIHSRDITLHRGEISSEKHVIYPLKDLEDQDSTRYECEQLVWSSDGGYIALLLCRWWGSYEQWFIDIRESHTGEHITSYSLPDPPYPQWTRGSGPDARWTWRSGHLVWAPNGTFLAAQAHYSFRGPSPLDGSVSVEDRHPSQIGIWEIATGNKIAHHLYARSPVWSPDGSQIAFINKTKCLEIRDGAAEDILQEYRVHSTPIHSIAWSPDSKHIASVSNDGTVHIWGIHSAQPILTLGGNSPLEITKKLKGLPTILWSPDGTQVAFIDQEGKIQIWQVV